MYPINSQHLINIMICFNIEQLQGFMKRIRMFSIKLIEYILNISQVSVAIFQVWRDFIIMLIIIEIKHRKYQKEVNNQKIKKNNTKNNQMNKKVN